MISKVLLRLGKNNGMAVYVHKETILNEMAASISKMVLNFNGTSTCDSAILPNPKPNKIWPLSLRRVKGKKLTAF
jgi:hypothetical protein